VAAVYKVSERLKANGYVHTGRHRRVNKRGPMREMLASDCGNCFFGYSTSESCLADSLRQIGDLVEAEFGTTSNENQRASLLNAMKSVDHACQTNRRVLNYLRLLREVQQASRDEPVGTLLRRLEAGLGVTIPSGALRRTSGTASGPP